MKKKTLLFTILLTITVAVSIFSILFTNTEPEALPDSAFTVYFIDVGQADSTLIVCDDKAMLIDGGNAADSNLIYAFLKEHEVDHLDYIVATHPHEDHVGGLAGALNYATVDIAFSPVAEYNGVDFNNFVKYLDAQDVSVTVPKPGDRYYLGIATIDFFGPLRLSSDPNNISLVLKVTYGENAFLFTGDAGRTVEQDVLNAGYDISATVLHIGHHGSDTSTSYPFLREVMPEYAVISCGKGNTYKHPHEETLTRLRDANVEIFRTDLQGTITCVSDGMNVSFSVEKNEDIVTNPTEPNTDESYYVGNISSHVFHRPDCSRLPIEKNQLIIDSYQDAIDAGYSPCSICNP